MANLQSLPILLKELRLNAMARSWEEEAHKAIEEQWQPEEYLAALCEIEAGHCHECRLKRLLRDSKLPTGKQLSQYDFNEISGISAQQIKLKTKNLDWVR
jgi:DNA replication protein DnaC